jgi:hypothetical protein
LTGRDITKHYDYAKEYDAFLNKEEQKGKKQGGFMSFTDFSTPQSEGNKESVPVFILSMISLAAVMFALSRKRKDQIQ